MVRAHQQDQKRTPLVHGQITNEKEADQQRNQMKQSQKT